MNRTRAAGDFATIRAGMEELRRERGGTQATEHLQRDPPMRRAKPALAPGRDWASAGAGPTIQFMRRAGREGFCSFDGRPRRNV